MLLPLLILGLSTSLIYLTQLGNPIAGGHSDETLYIEIAKEMMHRHEWIIPLYHGQIAFYKPPFLYWMMMISFKIFGGPTLFAARFPAALCGVALAIVTALLGKEMFGKKGGILAGWMTATSIPGVYAYARASLMDIPLTLAVTASLYFAFRACREKKSGFMALSLIFMGISTLFKGPVSFLICLVPILWMVFSESAGNLLLSKESLSGAAAMAAVLFFWPLATAFRGYGKSWLDFFLLQENFGKFSTQLDPTTHAVPASVILIHLFSQFLPWSFFLIAALMLVFFQKKEKKNPYFLLLIWTAVVVIIFLMPEKKLSHYTLPALPATALMAAGTATQFSSSFFSSLAFNMTGIILALAGSLTLLLSRITSGLQDTLIVAAAALSFLLGAIFLFKKKAQIAAYCAAGFLFFYALGLPHLMSGLDIEKLKQVAGEMPIYSYDFDAGILSKGLQKTVLAVSKPVDRSKCFEIRESGGILMLPADDQIDFLRNGTRLSQPLITWNGWKDHIRILDILQAILSGNRDLIRERVIAVKMK